MIMLARFPSFGGGTHDGLDEPVKLGYG